LHANSIIHRDIKPSNLLWNHDQKHLTICDFDLATWNHSTFHISSVGTDSFMAPEVLAFGRDVPYERKPYGQEIDLYSAGCVFAALMHSICETDMKEKYIYAWRKKYSKKSKEEEDLLFLKLLEHDPLKRISALHALQSNYIFN